MITCSMMYLRLGKSMPASCHQLSGWRGGMSSGVAAMTAFECSISSRYRAKTSAADSPGSRRHSAFSPSGKKSNDSPPTTLRNQ